MLKIIEMFIFHFLIPLLICLGAVGVILFIVITFIEKRREWEIKNGKRLY